MLEIEKVPECKSCEGMGFYMQSGHPNSGDPCQECLPPDDPNSCGGTGYENGRKRLHIKQIMRWLALEHDVQCSGKRLIGEYEAVEWCQLRAFHDGACEDGNGNKFHA